VEGSLMVNARGFGFVENPEGADLFIPLDNMGTGMDGDTVLAEIVRDVKGKKPVGKVLKVTKPSVKDLVGVFHREDGKGSGPKKIGARVIPDDERFKRPIEIPEQKITPKEGERAPREGEFVLVRRERWEDPRENPRGRIVEIIGSPDDPDIDTLIIAKGKGLRTEFPAKVMEEAEKLSLPNMRKEKKRREDLRNTLCFTIDPESAKDYDDAVSLEQLEDGTYELGVHIADVSYYVPEGSALDKEALERGTSVYFVNSVLPMLPEKLSNDLCSLRPDEDRLAFSVLMRLDSRGVIRDYRITESIIRSKRRFTYREVEDIIEGAKDPYAGTVHQMMMLSLVLRRAREEKGSIDFDVPVPVISLDEHGIPYEVRPSERIDANRMIEEFMLAANLTVARHIAGESATGAESPAPGDPEAAPARQGKSEKWPFIYRIHEKPDENEVREFLDLLGRLGINYRVPGDLEPEDYRKILDIIENLEFKDFAEKVALRSMTKAVYSTDNIGHFGLAFDAYTHFTSPIRRYPDLIVHRLLKRYAAKGAKPPARGTKAQLQKICEQCTEREIQAVEAEREHSKIKAMEFLAEKVGETYDGIIAGITSFGFFVELNHYLIEGLVHVSELRDDRYEFDKDNYTLTGERTGKAYRLGDPVRVTIKKVSVEERKADFILAEER
jgi:ribonuclease R